MKRSSTRSTGGVARPCSLLKLRLAKLPSGARLVIASRDAGAPIELPAWCRLTGHRLCEARPPFYLVEKRKE